MTPDLPSVLETLQQAAAQRPEDAEHGFDAAAGRVYVELFKLDMAYDSKPLDGDLLIWEVNPQSFDSGVYLDWVGAPGPRPLNMPTLVELYAAKAAFDEAPSFYGE